MRTTPVPPAGPIDVEVTSSVTPHFPLGPEGDRRVVDEDPQPGETTRVRSAKTEPSRGSAMGNVPTTKADCVPEKWQRFDSLEDRYDADVDKIRRSLQLIDSDRTTAQGITRRIAHAPLQVSGATAAAAWESNFGNTKHTEGGGVTVPFSSAIPVARARPPRKLFIRFIAP
jgi:hypothetical protein